MLMKTFDLLRIQGKSEIYPHRLERKMHIH